MKALYLFIPFLLFISCSKKADKLEAKRTVITGMVKNFENKENVLTVNFCDPFDDRQSAQAFKETDGYFHVEYDYIFSQNLTILYENRFINFFINPGDSVFITIDAEKMNAEIEDAVQFSGDNAELNREMFLWTTYAYKVNFPEPAADVFHNDFLATIKEKMKSVNDTMEAYSKNNKMSKFMKEWAIIDYKFSMSLDMNDYEINPDKWTALTDPIFDGLNEDNFQTMFFSYYLRNCLTALMTEDDKFRELMKEEKFVPATNLIIDRLFTKVPEGIIRDYMLFCFLKDVVYGTMPINDWIAEYTPSFSQPLFYNMLDEYIESKSNNVNLITKTGKKMNGVLYLNKDKSENLPEVELLPYLIDKYKNKVIYVEVWATWCKPCIEGMLTIPGLQKHFAGKDVVFVNVCLESKPDEWKGAINKHGFAGENYYLNNDATKLFKDEYNLSCFPASLLIDRNGNLHNPAPHLSEINLVKDKIEEYLN